MSGAEANTWLQQMNAAFRLSVGRHAQNWDAAAAGVAEVQRHLRDIGVAVDNVAAAQQATAEQEVAREAEAKLLAERFQELTRRELRVALRRFDSVPLQTYQRLLAARPDAWTELVDAYFEKWTTLGGSGRRAQFAQLLGDAPAGVRVLHLGLPSADLLGPRAPESVVKHRLWSNCESLVEYSSQQLRCRSYWEFFREVLAAWIETALASHDLTWVWSEMAAHRRVIEPLLPELTRQESWFDGQGLAKAGVAALCTQARVVARILRACLPRESDLQSSIVERLLRSVFGDPRVPPMSQGWEEVKAVDPGLFEKFLEALIKDDLSLFFRYAMDEADREHFWLRYLKQIRGTLVVLSRDRYQDIQRRLGAEDAGRAMLRRARKAESSGVSAFCLFFDRIVAVEFSEVGNAAYLYPREQFTKQMLPALNPVRSVTAALKRRDFRSERLLHHAGWQTDAAEILRRYGVR